MYMKNYFNVFKKISFMTSKNEKIKNIKGSTLSCQMTKQNQDSIFKFQKTGLLEFSKINLNESLVIISVKKLYILVFNMQIYSKDLCLGYAIKFFFSILVNF